MNDCIDGARLGRGIRRHASVHGRPEIRDPERKDQEERCEDRRFDRSSRTRAAKNLFEQSHCASLNVPSSSGSTSAVATATVPAVHL